jgi:hypothetical protein
MTKTKIFGYLGIFLVTTMMCSCASAPKETTSVPIGIPCKTKEVPVPDYQFDKLKSTDSIFRKIQVLLSDRQLAIAYEIELAAQVKSCQ